MLFGELTYEEIRDAAGAGALAVVPTGCTEQQGPHLPVDFDTWFASAVAEAAAEQGRALHGFETVVLPTVPFGPTPEHRNFGHGFIDLPRPVHEAVITAVVDSLAAQGFRTLVIWRGCGGHDLSAVVRGCQERQDHLRIHQPELPYRDVWLELGDPTDDGGHADGFATSMALHLRPGAVRTDRALEPLRPRSRSVPGAVTARSEVGGFQRVRARGPGAL